MKYKILLIRVIFPLIAEMLFALKINAQTAVIHQDSLYSRILKEERPIQIIFPKDYHPESEKYELLFTVGGILDFEPMIWQFLQGESFIPKNMIMIGVPTVYKGNMEVHERDYTPTRTYPNTGGAANFLSFYEKELIPYLNSKYPVKIGHNTLYGGSLGGLFVMYTFLNKPNLFTSYIAVEPSLWWDNFYLNKIAPQKLDSLKGLHNTLFIANREGAPFHFMGAYGMDSILRAKSPKDLVWTCVKLSNENHFSTNLKGLWDGLKFSYGGYYPAGIGFKPLRGIIIKNKPFKLTCYTLLAEKYIAYTIDGTEPTRGSPKLSSETSLALPGDATVKIKSFCIREEYDQTVTAYLTAGDVFPSLAKPENVYPGGLHFSYYTGKWDTMPDLKKLKPVSTGVADQNFDVNQFKAAENFVCLMEGYMEIAKDGYYIFEMDNANDDSKVYVGNHLILAPQFEGALGQNFMVPFRKGFYPIRIEYLHKKGKPDLVPVYLKPEGVDDFPIGTEMLYSRHSSQ